MTHHDCLRAIGWHTFQEYAHEFACPFELVDLIDLIQDGLLSFKNFCSPVSWTYNANMLVVCSLSTLGSCSQFAHPLYRTPL